MMKLLHMRLEIHLAAALHPRVTVQLSRRYMRLALRLRVLALQLPRSAGHIVAVFLPTVNFRYCRLWLIRLEINLAAALHSRVLVQLPRRNSEVFLTLTVYSQAVDLRIPALQLPRSAGHSCSILTHG